MTDYESGPVAPVNIVGILANSVPFTVQGAAGQTSNLTDWRDGAGFLLSRMDAFGRLGLRVAPSVSILAVAATQATDIGAIIRGFAAQSGNLQEWQNSATTILARVDSGGNIKAPNVATTNSLLQLIELNSGGMVFFSGQASAAPAAPSAGRAYLYLRPGSVSGSKLVAIGVNNVETLIADNL